MPKFALVLSLILMSGSIVCAQESRPAPGPPRNRPSVPTSLGAAMRDMGQAAKRLSTEATDPAQKDAALTDVLLLERDAAIAKTGMPDNVRNLSGDAKAKALTEFHSMITKLIRDLFSLEDAINAGKSDDAKTLLAQIGEDEKDGHAKFKTD